MTSAPQTPNWPGYTPPLPLGKGTWKSPTNIVAIIITAAVIAVAALWFLGDRADKKAISALDVIITTCTLTGTNVPVAKVRYTVTNNGDVARAATLTFEYRDAGGARLDTDTARVQTLTPGDTARAEESTVLDGPTNTLDCFITSVR
jgi:hypothetical protein